MNGTTGKYEKRTGEVSKETKTFLELKQYTEVNSNGMNSHRSIETRPHRKSMTLLDYFICDVCNHSFRNGGELRKHTWSHFADKTIKDGKMDSDESIYTRNVFVEENKPTKSDGQTELCSTLEADYDVDTHTIKEEENSFVKSPGISPLPLEETIGRQNCLRPRNGTQNNATKISLNSVENVSVTSPLASPIKSEVSPVKSEVLPVKSEVLPVKSDAHPRLLSPIASTIKMEVHLPVLQCGECHKTFSNQYQLNRHKIKHTRLYCCKICDHSFCQDSDLRRHRVVHVHKTFKCGSCDKEFNSKKNMHRHEKRHTDIKRHVCTVCEKRFHQSSDLRRHQTTHTGEKSYQCAICEKMFSTTRHLQVHMRSHNKNKTFKCSSCEKAFNVQSNLKRHEQTVHKKEKWFKCEHCDKCFAEKGNLKTHTRIHSQEKPFVCTACGKAFSDRGNYDRHVKTHDHCYCTDEENMSS